MKILLRKFDGEQYVWKKAKYNNQKFYVDGASVRQTDIVSIINDNRKNYIECSCCQQIFRRGDRRFQAHKENAIKPETCFGCQNCRAENKTMAKQKFEFDPYRGFIEKVEYDVHLVCTETGYYSYYGIDSDVAIARCAKRQCANAVEIEIADFFTDYPGVFDDIITIDGLLDNGYNVSINGDLNVSEREIIITDDYTIGVCINKLGIVDRFYVWVDGDVYYIYYSKRYNELFCKRHGNYAIWEPYNITDDMENEIKNQIAKLYC